MSSAPHPLQVQIEKTIWSKVDDSSVHRVMDLKQFEETFSAYQRKESDVGSGLAMGTLQRRTILDRPKELSVIDGKRAQNCSIVLSTLKMTNEKVCVHIHVQGWTPECPLGSSTFCPCVLYGVRVVVTFLSSLYALS